MIYARENNNNNEKREWKKEHSEPASNPNGEWNDLSVHWYSECECVCCRSFWDQFHFARTHFTFSMLPYRWLVTFHEDDEKGEWNACKKLWSRKILPVRVYYFMFFSTFALLFKFPHHRHRQHRTWKCVVEPRESWKIYILSANTIQQN